MIAAILLGGMLQAAVLPPKVWTEHNQPEMPIVPPFELGDGTTIAYSIKELPTEVAGKLVVFFGAADPMSDAGGPFDSTDVIDGRVPTRRFVRAYQTGRYWVIWYERGVVVSGLRTIALQQGPARPGLVSMFEMAPGTALAGDLCVATKAIGSGVRTSNP